MKAYSLALTKIDEALIRIIDSGSEPAPDFDRITSFYDFTGGHVRQAKPSDGHGHGTHVAGLIGSRFVGVAPGNRLVGSRVRDEKGDGQTRDVLRAIWRDDSVVGRRPDPGRERRGHHRRLK
jgi:subtilisin family serine protease